MSVEIKVIRFYSGLVLQRLVIGLKKLAPLSQPVRSKTKPLVTCSCKFFRTSRQLNVHLFASSFDWITVFFLCPLRLASMIAMVLILRHSQTALLFKNNFVLKSDFRIRIPVAVTQRTTLETKGV